MIPIIIKFSKKFDVKEKAGGRKRHKKEISMLGGVPIYIVFILSNLFFWEPSNPLPQIFVLLAFSLLFLTGLYDDIKPLNAAKKFFFQILSAALLVYFADVHHSSYFTQLAISDEIVKIISLVFIVFIINAYNLIDGINGLSAMLSVVAIMCFGVWFYAAGFENNAYICFAMSASILVFLKFNLFNTKIFLGDNGSMLMGLSIAYFSILFIQYNQNLGSETSLKLISPFGLAIAAMSIPIMDTLRLFTLRIFYLQKSPFKADRNHLHHLLLRLGLSHIQISLLLSGLSALLIIFALSVQNIGNTGIVFVIILTYIALLIALDYFIFNQYRKKLPKKTVFNEAIKIKEELNNPMVYEFFFALSFFILAISIPFHRVSTSIPTILILFSFVLLIISNFIRKRQDFHIIFKSESLKFLKHPYSILVLLVVIYYTIHYLVFPTKGGNSLSLKFLILIFWLPFFELRKIINIKPEIILRSYVYGCFGFSIYILYHAFFSFHKLGWEAFFYSDLLSHVKANPITHSLYFNLAIIFLSVNFHKLKNKIWQYIHLAILFVLISMVVLFGSKLGYVALFLSLATAVFFICKSKLQRLTVVSIIAIYALFGYYQVPFLNNKVDNLIWQITNHENISIENRLPRSIIWHEAIVQIKENWLFGTGVGNSMNVLEKRYKLIDYKKGIKNRYNCHNQFLENFLQTGIFGFLSLLLIFIYCFNVAFKNKSKTYLLFLATIILYMMAESLFETQMGMVAFAFFNALFISSFAKKNGAINGPNQNSLE
ncbi:MAG: O-antigen ligase family protein [Chitinophagales bacterium]